MISSEELAKKALWMRAFLVRVRKLGFGLLVTNSKEASALFAKGIAPEKAADQVCAAIRETLGEREVKRLGQRAG